MRSLALFFLTICALPLLAEEQPVWHGTWYGYTHMKERVELNESKWVRHEIPLGDYEPGQPQIDHVREKLAEDIYLIEDDRGGFFKIMKIFVEGEGDDMRITLSPLGKGQSVEEAKERMKQGTQRSDGLIQLMGMELHSKASFDKFEALPSLDEITLEKLLEVMDWEQVKAEIDDFLSWHNSMGKLDEARRRVFRLVRSYSERKMLDIGYNHFKSEGPNPQRRFGGDPKFQERMNSLSNYIDTWQPK